MNDADLRPPPCPQCGLVEPARGPRHTCNPAHELVLRVGVDRAVAIGRAVIAAIGSLGR